MSRRHTHVRRTPTGVSSALTSYVMEQIESRTHHLETLCSRTQLIWRIDEFQRRFEDAATGKHPIIYSPAFTTHPCGYHIAISLCPNGDGKAKGDYMSVFFCILKGEHDALLPWPFSQDLSFTLLDQTNARYAESRNSKQRKYKREEIGITSKFTPNTRRENLIFVGKPTGLRNPSIGIPRFVLQQDLWEGNYIVDDVIYIRVGVDLTDLITA